MRRVIVRDGVGRTFGDRFFPTMLIVESGAIDREASVSANEAV